MALHSIASCHGVPCRDPHPTSPYTTHVSPPSLCYPMAPHPSQAPSASPFKPPLYHRCSTSHVPSAPHAHCTPHTRHIPYAPHAPCASHLPLVHPLTPYPPHTPHTSHAPHAPYLLHAHHTPCALHAPQLPRSPHLGSPQWQGRVSGAGCALSSPDPRVGVWGCCTGGRQAGCQPGSQGSRGTTAPRGSSPHPRGTRALHGIAVCQTCMCWGTGSKVGPRAIPVHQDGPIGSSIGAGCGDGGSHQFWQCLCTVSPGCSSCMGTAPSCSQMLPFLEGAVGGTGTHHLMLNGILHPSPPSCAPLMSWHSPIPASSAMALHGSSHPCNPAVPCIPTLPSHCFLYPSHFTTPRTPSLQTYCTLYLILTAPWYPAPHPCNSIAPYIPSMLPYIHPCPPIAPCTLSMHAVCNPNHLLAPCTPLLPSHDTMPHPCNPMAPYTPSLHAVPHLLHPIATYIATPPPHSTHYSIPALPFHPVPQICTLYPIPTTPLHPAHPDHHPACPHVSPARTPRATAELWGHAVAILQQLPMGTGAGGQAAGGGHAGSVLPQVLAGVGTRLATGEGHQAASTLYREQQRVGGDGRGWTWP